MSCNSPGRFSRIRTANSANGPGTDYTHGMRVGDFNLLYAIESYDGCGCRDLNGDQVVSENLPDVFASFANSMDVDEAKPYLLLHAWYLR